MPNVAPPAADAGPAGLAIGPTGPTGVATGPTGVPAGPTGVAVGPVGLVGTKGVGATSGSSGASSSRSLTEKVDEIVRDRKSNQAMAMKEVGIYLFAIGFGIAGTSFENGRWCFRTKVVFLVTLEMMGRDCVIGFIYF